MPKKPESMARVHMDRSHTYQLDSARKRTLPPGWTGEVPAKVAKEIVAAGAGRIQKTARGASGGGAPSGAGASGGAATGGQGGDGQAAAQTTGSGTVPGTENTAPGDPATGGAQGGAGADTVGGAPSSDPT